MNPQPLKLYNTLTRQKELFESIHPSYVGMYVCGPTVYSSVHLGNVRTFLTFDILYRYLLHLGYKVRYVRNITDVGHLENDADDGEDKISKKARLEQLEPMEVVQFYTNNFHDVLRTMNMLPPSIEPSATGHMVEQIEAVKELISKGYAYESNGSVYFDINTYQSSYQNYGQLSGRVIEELINETRELDGQSEKQNPLDFAIWKKASSKHIMRWKSPWGEGFPGWHLECTCMSTKYLGTHFDIHGGGMDLKFPHHECEIAQAVGINGVQPVKYWMHSNMLTLNGEKMSKSKDNSILPDELFTGQNLFLTQAYSPMTVRFFMLQSQYRSVLDLSNDALQASGKAYRRLINGLHYIKTKTFSEVDGVGVNEKHLQDIKTAAQGCYDAMNDDLNTAVTIAKLFDLLKKINQLQLGQIQSAELGEEGFNMLRTTYVTFIEEVLGLKEEKPDAFELLLSELLTIYKDAKVEKNYTKIDEIRAQLKQIGVVVRDMKTGIAWAYEE
ncbi:cysteine--tRNA ligase [Xanthocytophaga flava]|uniref:cysteine--tRNA ligase n=1 Tax=Xanthocytophaga flava TaxID=3048013 RepID=UPI0028D027AF|nr:cysteine--tRNA ligase [Xanthocytophaga flavus]MDJ1470048.1 cysteine--tRNA ligase [Xanthocytophaga flavus]